MDKSTYKEYTRGGYHFIECEKCGARFNSGRVGNGPGLRWARELRRKWWGHHTGHPYDGVLELCDEDIPPLCPSIGSREKESLERAAAADYERLRKKHEELCAAVVDALEKDESALYAKGEPVETSLRVAVKNTTAAAGAVNLAADWYA